MFSYVSGGQKRGSVVEEEVVWLGVSAWKHGGTSEEWRPRKG